MGTVRSLVVYLLVLIGVGLGLISGVTYLAGQHARNLVGVVLGGYERFTLAQTSAVFKRLSASPEVQRLERQSCQSFGQEMEHYEGFFAVLALGDAAGNPICDSNLTEPDKLPTMADRVYYQRVKNSQDMVIGEYAVSRTTGKQVIHFAYPLRSAEGELRGFILAAINLGWFANQEVDNYIDQQGVEILGVDERGRVLFSYPTQADLVGEQVVSAQMVGTMFAKESRTHIMRGHDGVYRLYGYKMVEEGDNKQILFMVGLSPWSFAPLAGGVFGLMTICALVGWYWAGVIWQKRLRVNAKKK